MDDFVGIAGESQQAIFISNYARDQRCTRILVEESYTDKEYMIDYQKFYSRSFDDYSKVTKRVHFFKDGVDEDMLFSPDVKDEEIGELYLGFSVIKPIESSRDVYIIGRTLLKCYSDDPGRRFVTIRERVSLYGRSLVLETAPFISQDLAVGACATAAIWVVLNVVSRNLGLEMRSMYEITESAHRIPGAVRIEGNAPSESIRCFPSTGLDSHQICYYLQSLGLETDVLYMGDGGDVGNGTEDGADADRERQDYLAMALTASLDCGMPLIACLNMKAGDTVVGYHAVAIVGYSMRDGRLYKLYVHDDQIGPFSSVMSGKKGDGDDGFRTWEYTYNDRWKGSFCDTIEFDHVIIPMYHKVRLPMTWVRTAVTVSKHLFGCGANVSLRTISDYKAELLRRGMEDREVLTIQFPRYVWVIRSESDEEDIVVDATSPMLLKYCRIDLVTGEFSHWTLP